MKGVSYVSKQRDGGATSSTDDDEQEQQGADAASDAGELDEDGENKSENSPRSPVVKAASTSSVIKKKGEVVSYLHLCVMTKCNF